MAAAVILGGLFATHHPEQRERLRLSQDRRPGAQGERGDDLPAHLSRPLLFVVLAVLVAPLLEETFFRGFVFQGLARSWGPLLGAVSSALIFALWHQQLSVLVPIFGLGILLAAAFYWTKSIYTNIAFHAVFNAFGIVAWWFVTKG